MYAYPAELSQVSEENCGDQFENEIFLSKNKVHIFENKKSKQFNFFWTARIYEKSPEAWYEAYHDMTWSLISVVNFVNEFNESILLINSIRLYQQIINVYFINNFLNKFTTSLRFHKWMSFFSSKSTSNKSERTLFINTLSGFNISHFANEIPWQTISIFYVYLAHLIKNY